MLLRNYAMYQRLYTAAKPTKTLSLSLGPWKPHMFTWEKLIVPLFVKISRRNFLLLFVKCLTMCVPSKRSTVRQYTDCYIDVAKDYIFHCRYSYVLNEIFCIRIRKLVIIMRFFNATCFKKTLNKVWTSFVVC